MFSYGDDNYVMIGDSQFNCGESWWYKDVQRATIIIMVMK